jgi:hypothetical protein
MTMPCCASGALVSEAVTQRSFLSRLDGRAEVDRLFPLVILVECALSQPNTYFTSPNAFIMPKYYETTTTTYVLVTVPVSKKATPKQSADPNRPYDSRDRLHIYYCMIATFLTPYVLAANVKRSTATRSIRTEESQPPQKTILAHPPVHRQRDLEILQPPGPMILPRLVHRVRSYPIYVNHQRSTLPQARADMSRDRQGTMSSYTQHPGIRIWMAGDVNIRSIVWLYNRID